MLMALLTANT